MKPFFFLAGLFAASFACQARAGVVDFTFSGPGVSGNIHLTYGPATDAKYPGAFEATGISGTFSDSNLGIVNAAVTSLVGITRDAPELSNLLAPNDFSKFAVAAGLTHGDSLSYDNLYWPSGSPPTATDYTVHGGFLDIYGLLFNIDGGKVVNLWSNGDFTGTGSGPIDYGVAVVTPESALHYVAGGVSASPVPEPGTFGLVGIGLVSVLTWRRQRSACRSC
jgi:hypothetical protein